MVILIFPELAPSYQRLLVFHKNVFKARADDIDIACQSAKCFLLLKIFVGMPFFLF